MTRSSRAGVRAFALGLTLLVAQPALADAGRFHGPWGVDLADQDPSVRPGDNFAMFQNGGWYARTDLGPTRSSDAHWGDVRVEAARQLNGILQQLARDKSANPAGPMAKAGAFYRAALDEDAAEAKGISPLRPELAAIRAVRTRAQMARLIGAVEGPGTLRVPSVRVVPARGIFQLAIAQDQANPHRYAVYVGQGGLMLPGPEYYADPKLADIKAAYEAHVGKMLGLIGWPHPEQSAHQVVALETRIAAVSWSHEQMRDAAAAYNPMTVAQLRRLAPQFDWRAFFAGAELGGVDRVVVDAKDAFPKIAAVYAETPLAVVQARQAYAAADIGAGRLSSALHRESIAFQSQALQGLQAYPSREFEAEKWLEAAMPDALSAPYVARYSSPEIKAKATEMAEDMKAALDARLQRIAWMSPETRFKAREKLAAMRFHIGYPDRFQDYAGLVIRDDDFYGDVSRAAAYGWRRQVRRLNRPFDLSDWALTPIYPQYNYAPTTNTVEIPAALLAPPFFDPKADDAVNYGADGAVIGAMIAAAFGGVGINYDAQGRLRPWLTPQDRARFVEMSHSLSARYSAEEPLPGVHIKGDLVVDEAINDIGALRIALDAYHASLKGKSAPVIDGYSGDQRFFLGRAQMWRAKFSTNFQRNQLATGSNAPPYMRINGPVAQIDEWYAAFGVKPGDRLYVAPEARLPLW